MDLIKWIRICKLWKKHIILSLGRRKTIDWHYLKQFDKSTQFIIDHCKNLEIVDLTSATKDGSFSSAPFLQKLFNCQPHLTSVSLPYIYFRRDISITQLIKCLPVNLISLNLNFRVSSSIIRVISSHFGNNLLTLLIGRSAQHEDCSGSLYINTINYMLKKCYNLSTLSLNYNHNHEHNFYCKYRFFNNINYQTMPCNLTHLTLKYNYITIEHMNILSVRCKLIHTLHIWTATKYIFIAILVGMQNKTLFPALSKLHLSYCSSLRNKHHHLIEKLSTTRQIHIYQYICK